MAELILFLPLCAALGDCLCIPTPNTGQLNPLFHTFAEFTLVVNRVLARQSTDWLAANAQFSPNAFVTPWPYFYNSEKTFVLFFGAQIKSYITVANLGGAPPPQRTKISLIS